MKLYHGSKAGIEGSIRPISRSRCDFGRGFYMSSNPEQSLTLICNYPAPVLYTVEFDLAPLRTLELSTDLSWALLVAYNRGKLDDARNLPLYRQIATLADGYDVIAGAIANDRMFIVLDRFFNGEITDAALVASLSALQLGVQFAAITQRACDRIAVIEERPLTPEELSALKEGGERNRARGIALAEEICRQHRREGRYFDEIIQEGL